MRVNTLSLVDIVNPLMGTRSVREFSRGNTLPLVQRPWAMTAWSLVTGEDPWYFHPDIPKLRGIRATRQPSPWIGDYGDFTLCPQTGPLVTDAFARASAYRLAQSVIAPHRLRTEFLRYRTTVDLAPTERGALMRFTFQAGGTGRLLIEVPKGNVAYDPASQQVTGCSTSSRGGVPASFACSFLLRFSQPVSRHGGTGPLCWVEFDLPPGGVVEACAATSFIDHSFATLSLEREIGQHTLEDLLTEGAAAWNRLLGRFAITGGSDPQRRTFYSCLYRALCFPRRIHEFTAAGDPVHLNMADGSTAKGVLCADNGFWDTHRTVYPLYALAYRDELPGILEGWIQVARDTGWLPTWSSPGHRACMIGTHIDAVFAEAVAKGIGGFDLDAAWQALRRHATETPPMASVGRRDLADYLAHGYLPAGKGIHSVSATLDFAYGDWCLGQIARHLGNHQDARMFSERAHSWKHLFDPASGFFRPRAADGQWTPDFDPLSWGGAFVEGSAWQCGWAVPHDPEGLMAALGGPDATVAKLDALLAHPAHYRVGPYPEEIHEMTEMSMVDFGQYAHCNQPSHGILWFYALAGRPGMTETLTRRVLDELYSPGVDGFCGDEDNGEMGAWYVWAALGLYPFCPGSPDYVLGSPLFPEITVESGDGRSLTVQATGNTATSPEVHRRTLGAKDITGPRISLRALFDAAIFKCDGGAR